MDHNGSDFKVHFGSMALWSSCYAFTLQMYVAFSQIGPVYVTVWTETICHIHHIPDRCIIRDICSYDDGLCSYQCNLLYISFTVFITLRC